MTVEQSGRVSSSEVGGETVPLQKVGSHVAVRSPFVLLGDAGAEACGPDGCALPDGVLEV